MTDIQHDHDHPDIADMRAVLATGSHILLGADPERVHQIAAEGACPACRVMSAVQLGFALATSVAGEPFVTQSLRARLLAQLKVAQAELDSGLN